MPDSEGPDHTADRWHSRRIAAFLGIGAMLYLLLLAGAELLVRSTGDQNPFFKIVTATGDQDWLILGASHAMPLGFGDSEARIEAATGQRILNLSVKGSGPFVWMVVADRFFVDHRANHVLIVVDGFAFQDRRWNEDRLGDTDLMTRIPWDLGTLFALGRALGHGLPIGSFADYATGFSKIGNPTRFQPDVWEGEAKFEQRARPSDAADRARIAYLYPESEDDSAADRAFAQLAALVQLSKRHGADVTLVRPPVPDRFLMRLPDEAEFITRLGAFAGIHGITLADMAAGVPDPRFYFDPDHLNRAGVDAWLDAGLRELFRGDDRRQ